MSHHTLLILGVFTGGELVAWLVGRSQGLGASLAVMLAVSALMDEIGPRFPGSPLACMNSHVANACAGTNHWDWLVVLLFLLPLGVGLLYKEITQHKSKTR
jgi:hypothetical protein